VIVTEDQARALWCPQSRVAFPGQNVANRPASAMMRFAEQEALRTGAAGDSRDLQYLREQRADCNCIASACMFWQFVGYRKVRSGNDEAHGCCGLVGINRFEIPVDLKAATEMPR
jgi:hypothetical protein